jgi:site-specific DNA-methyltransferase (adenine-specific)
VAELVWKEKQKVSSHDQCLHSPSKQLFIVKNHPIEQADNVPADTWHNRLIHGDKSDVLPLLLREFGGAVNLIYIDPPFMTGRDFMGAGEDGPQLAYSDKWGHDIDTYLQWLYETFTLLHTLLAHNGSLYVHLDWRASHYAKVMLDEVFACKGQTGDAGFKSEIIWSYQSGGRSRRGYARKHDTIMLYTKSADYCFHGERVSERRGVQRRNHMRKQVQADGHITWTIRSNGRIYEYDEDMPMTPGDVWNDISHLHQKDPQRNGYATQKPEALLERIMLASSEEDDLALDCFCGSGVTPAVAERLGRRWIACDQSRLAIQLTEERLLADERDRPFIVQEVKETFLSGETGQ